MAIYRGSPSRFSFAQASSNTHYTTTASNQISNMDHIQMQLRYNSYGIEGHSVPLPATPPPPPRSSSGILSIPAPPGATLGLSLSKQLSGSVPKGPIYSAPLYINPLSQKPYPPQPSDLLLVSPGIPTPIELSIYENKQPTGLLHVTIGNQTVEFLDGVANMPQKR